MGNRSFSRTAEFYNLPRGIGKTSSGKTAVVIFLLLAKGFLAGGNLSACQGKFHCREEFKGNIVTGRNNYGATIEE